VAEVAGVSISTAARVLREGPNRVKPDLAARVMEAAGSLGYTPNLMARSLRAGSPPLMGLMVGDMLDPYFAAIGEYVTVEADTLGLAAMVANMRRDPVREIELLQRFLQHRVSGVLLSGGGYDQDSQHDELARTVTLLQSAGCHVASLTDRGLDIPTFSEDNDAVGRMAAEAVLDLGHRKAAVVYAPPRSEVTRGRRAATLRTLEEGGATVRETVARYTREAGFEAAAQVFRGRRASWPTAVVAGSDSLAVGILAWLQACGVAVPDEVSVVGIGDTYAAETLRLTSVGVALDERSKAAVHHLAGLIEGREDGVWQGAQPQLLDRGSVAPPKRP
jgi:LacI family transcriptional regulator